jgi:hypothetical protein
MLFFLSWIILSFVIGIIGGNRKIGFLGAFLLSIFLSPLIGLIVTLVSKNEEDEKYKEKVFAVQQRQQEALKNIADAQKTKSVSIADELEKLRKLKEDNLITEDEFQSLKNRIINS